MANSLHAHADPPMNENLGRNSPENDVLVAGATSLIGRFLLSRARAAGLRSLALSRRGGEVRADLTQGQALAEVLPPIRRMTSLAPIWLLPAALPVLADKGLERLVAFSSTSRFTKAASPVPEERAVADKLAKAEDEVITFCTQRGIAWTLLRPTLIYAEGEDQNVSRLARLIRRFGVLPLSGDGQGRRQPVHADDLAAAALAALETPAAFNRAYDLPGGETLTYKEMCQRIFEALGRSPRILSAPPAVWSAAFALAKPLLPGATAAMGARMAEDLVFDAEPAKRDFGYAPRDFRPKFPPFP
jgi:nucleoside-diphosphate-sugar epimerase